MLIYGLRAAPLSIFSFSNNHENANQATKQLAFSLLNKGNTWFLGPCPTCVGNHAWVHNPWVGGENVPDFAGIILPVCIIFFVRVPFTLVGLPLFSCARRAR